MKKLYIALLFVIVFAGLDPIYAQAPNISYATPKVYTLNTPITSLAPTNTGGVVPATVYGQTLTFSGSGNIGAANGAGSTASFHNPYGSCIDASGNIYVADTYNHLIRKITSAGVVSTFAGSGSPALANGTGTAASFYYPGGLAIDAAGNIYVGDQGNNAIRKITSAGVVSTLAGNGFASFSNGTGAAATFSSPAGIALDGSGNVYVADRTNNMIRKITPAGVVTTLAGTGLTGNANGPGASASFSNPTGVAVDASGNIFVTDQNNYLIRKITSAGVVTTLAGTGAQGSTNGLSTAASFNKPFGLAVDQVGNVYVADEFNQLVREITPSGYVNTLAGSGIMASVDGIGTAASFNYPAGMVSDGAGYLYVTETGGQKIRKIVTTGYVIDKPLPAGLAFDPTTGIISGTPTVASPATNYTVTAYNATGSSTTVVNIAVISVIAQTITFPAIANKVYGTADLSPGATVSSGLPITYTSSNPAIAPITASGNIHIVGVGTVTITASQGGNSTYSAATPVTQTLTVTQAPLTITADSKTKVYGAANPPLTITFSGFVNGETTAVLTTQPTITTVAANLPVNIYQITPSGASAANYYISYVIGQLTVTPAPLTITVDNQTKTSGQANPALTFSYSGFVNGDTQASMSNFPVIQTTATTSSPAGTYPITAVGAVNTNYNISYVPGTLTVFAAQTITFNPPPAHTYGDADFTLPATASSGLPVTFAGSDPTVATVSASGVVHIVSAGTITITASQIGNTSYGAAADATQTLTINPAPLTITAANKTKPYGSANPALTITYSGFVNGETTAVLTSPATVSTVATISSPVNVYQIIPSGAAAANYTMIYVNGSLTITPVALTITADNQSRAFAQPNPPLTATYTGFVNSDNATSLSALPTLQTTATIASPVGTYPITVSGAIDPNYTISYVPGTFSVLLAQTITTFAPIPTKTYGDPDFTISATASSGLPVTFTSSDQTIASVPSPGTIHIISAGTVTITASQSGNTNYAAAPPVTQTLTINPAALTITADNKSRIYNTANPPLTISYSGFVNNETSAVLTTLPTVATTATLTSGAGTYPITLTAAASGNYTITEVPGTLTINKAPQTITFVQIPDQRQGDPDITLIVTTTSGLSPITVTSSDATIAPVTGLTVKLLAVGTITLTATQAGDANYLPATAVQTLTIAKALPDLVLIHPLVTPNGDGINDILQIEGIEKYPDNRLTLVSRNGVKIYEISGYNNSTVCFVGYSNITNALQPQGTYFYSLQFIADGKTQKRVGFIVLKY